MRILVTGAAGFIGSHVVEALVDAGCDVIGIDSLHPLAHADTPSSLNRLVDFEHIDLTDEERLRKIVADIEGVSHQAAMVGLGESFDDAPRFVRANDLGTAVLLRELFRSRFSGPFVLASSMAVYGEGAYRCVRDGIVRPAPRRINDLECGIFEPRCPSCGSLVVPMSITEDFPTDPRNVYAATKLHQEHLCFSFGRETDARVVALRYHNVYGPRMPADTPYSGVAAMFRTSIEQGRAAEVYEDGRQQRDFIHVSDVAAANVLAVTVTNESGAFNIATGQPRSIGEMAQRLWEASGGEVPPPLITGDYRLGDVRHVYASPEKAQTSLGFYARVGFERGIEAFAHDPLRGRAVLKA